MSVKQPEHDFGEATVTSKGQITVPHDLRKALDISAGDRLRFVQARDGSIRLEPRKRRRIVDIARANAFRAGDAMRELSAAAAGLTVPPSGESLFDLIEDA